MLWEKVLKSNFHQINGYSATGMRGFTSLNLNSSSQEKTAETFQGSSTDLTLGSWNWWPNSAHLHMWRLKGNLHQDTTHRPWDKHRYNKMSSEFWSQIVTQTWKLLPQLLTVEKVNVPLLKCSVLLPLSSYNCFGHLHIGSMKHSSFQ